MRKLKQSKQQGVDCSTVVVRSCDQSFVLSSPAWNSSVYQLSPCVSLVWGKAEHLDYKRLVGWEMLIRKVCPTHQPGRLPQGHIQSHNRYFSAIPGRAVLERAGIFAEWEIFVRREVKRD